MTKTLILIRHAKSDWVDPTLPDHDRPLNERGRAAAGLVGAELAGRDLPVDEVLCSSALRTRETCALMTAAWPGLPAPVLVPKLYHASPDTMLSVLRRAKGECVLMLGHNPGIAVFAAQLLVRAPRHPRFGIYPTAAVLIAEFPVDDWTELQTGTGTCAAFFVPRDLPGHP